MQLAVSRIVRALAGLFVALWFAGMANAQATYTFTGGTYSATSNHTAADCTAVGGCADYSTAQSIAGSFTVAAPLAANLTNSAVSASAVSSYSFSDGINTISSSNPGARILSLSVTTNSSGTITSAGMSIQKWRDGLASGHVAIAASSTTSNGRFDSMEFSNSTGYAFNNRFCTIVGVSSAGAADSCLTSPPQTDEYTSSGTALSGSWTSPAPATVPTLSEWAMIGLAGLLAILGMLSIQRGRRPPAPTA